jgi:SNF2 family DNA or RNA helicase
MRLKTGVSLWEHQQLINTKATAAGRLLMEAGCGIGKTLGVANHIVEAGYDLSLILTIKPALRSVWEREFEEKIDGANVLVLDKGTSAEKAERLKAVVKAKTPNLVVVSNYETARLLPLDLYRWNFAAADESHRLASHNSAQSTDLAWMLRDVPNKIAMTGTAWADRPTQLFGQERFLHPKKNGKTIGSETFGSWTRFFDRYVDYRMSGHIKIPKKYINLDELQEKIASFFLYIDRDKVLDLPPVQHITRRVNLEPAHRKAYEELKKEMIVRFDNDVLTIDNVLVLALRLHQIAGGFYKPDGSDEIREIKNGTAKLDALLGIAEEIGREPFIIFTRFKEDVERIEKALRSMDISTKKLVGGKDEHMEWQQGKGQALIANIQAGSAGINLTRACYGVFYSTGHSRTDYLQACARIDRPGQTRNVTLFHVLAGNTVDIDIHNGLTRKGEVASELLNHFKLAVDKDRNIS